MNEKPGIFQTVGEAFASCLGLTIISAIAMLVLGATFGLIVRAFRWVTGL